MTSVSSVHIDSRARLEIMIAVLLAMFLSALDQTIVSTALPTIVTDLQGAELYTWVVTIYLLTATISGPIWAKLSDLFGRRLILTSGVGIFLVGSALSGLSNEMWQLIAARGIQGIGAGAIFPVALAVIGDLFEPAERAKYQGLFGAVFGVSALIGPALGGLLTDTVGWHWVFFVNIPIGLVSMVIIWRLLPAFRHPERARSIDYLGSAVFASALVPILVGLTNAQRLDWTDPLVGGLILLGLALAAVFVFVESRAAEPILPLGLFRIRTLAVSLGVVFLAAFGFFSAIIFLPLWFQAVQGASATQSGYYSLPLLAGLIISSVVSGQLISRTGKYKLLIVVAMAVMTVGLFGLTHLQTDTPLPVIWAWMLVTGLGIGPTLASFTVVIQNAAPVQQLGAATGALTFFRQVGGTVGLAVAGTLFGTVLTEQVPIKMADAGVPPQIIAGFGQAGISAGDLSGVGDLAAKILAILPDAVRPLVEPYIPQIVSGFDEAFTVAIATTMWIGVITALVAAVITLIGLPELPLRRWGGSAEVAKAEAEPAPMIAFD
jgi:EmrB/QacA subfamily drug resistance transporter